MLHEEFKRISEKIFLITLSALLFGFGWHIRGSGTSDPTVVILLFLLLTSFVFSPKVKFNYIIFGLVVLIFRIMRRGWGTFVAMAGLPGLWDGHLISYQVPYDVIVPWWQGYFWLFFVGMAWSSMPSLLLGGYFFSGKDYTLKDLIICSVLYTIGYYIGIFVALLLIPIISPEAYTEVYLAGLSERNFISMRDNFAATFAIIPVYLYIAVKKKDYKFIERSFLIMIFFGIGLSVADIWQVLGRNIPSWGIPFWSLWEYTSGFIVGGLIMTFFLLLDKQDWRYCDSIKSEDQFNTDKSLFHHFFFEYFIGHCALFLYGIQESLIGLYNSLANYYALEFRLKTWMGIVIILLIDLPFYILLKKNKIGNEFSQRSFKEKSAIFLMLLLPIYFLCYVTQFVVSGSIWTLDHTNLHTIFDVISFFIVEFSVIVYFIIYKRRKVAGMEESE
ncbi:MAG: hypothetical protein GF364_04950 [Candidatus Lokiarchaeota archaeon]|nr:hypothetical protein [Candidatus Lokiarchaeota archaeon]